MDALTMLALADEGGRPFAERWASVAALCALALAGVVAATGLIVVG